MPRCPRPSPLLAAAAAAVLSGFSLATAPPTSSSASLTLPDRDLRRDLRQDGPPPSELSSLNAVLSDITLRLPDAQVSRSGLDLTITDIECSDLSVGEISVSTSAPSAQLRTIRVDVGGVAVSCDFGWQYSWSFLGGTGTGTVTTDPAASDIGVGVNFVSDDFDEHPPNDVVVGDCSPGLEIDELELSEEGFGLSAAIFNLFKDLLEETIEGELNTLMCDEIYALDDEGQAFDDMLQMVSEGIETHLGGDGGGEVDPLSAEKNATVPVVENGDPLWINFLELEQRAQEMLGVAFDELAGKALGVSSSPVEGQELWINDFVRNNVLNEDGVIVLDDPASVVSSGGGDDPLFEIHDMFTQTAVYLKSVSVGGLDTFTEADVLNPIGNYTLQNQLKLDQLTIRLDMEVVVAASSKSDAVIAADDSATLTESIVVEIAVNDIGIDFAVFLGVNKRSVGGLDLGPLGHTENIMPCLLGTVDEAKLASLAVTVADISSPTLSGFLDPGLDDIISTGGGALLGMYEPLLLRAVPDLFETTLRDMINEFVDDSLDETEPCPPPDSSLTGIVDYRDLFLPEEESLALLGRGGEPYGDLYPLLYGFAQDALSSLGAEEVSWLTDALAPLAGLESSEESGVVMEGDLFRQTLDVSLNGLNAFIDLGVSDVKVSGLDSLGHLSLLQPVMGEPSMLNNTMSIGVGAEPIEMEMTLLVKGKGDKVEVNNEVELSLSLKDMEMMLVILAQMQEPSFLNFPLGDVLDLQCWLATIVPPEIDKQGNRVGEADTGLTVQAAEIEVSEARLSMNCVTCSGPMMQDLEEAMLTEGGVAATTDVVNMLLDLGKDLLGGNYSQSAIDQMVHEARYRCPHSPYYQKDFAGIEYEELDPVQSGEDSYGFLIAIVAVIAVVAALAVAMFFAAMFFSRRRHNRWLETLARPEKLELARMQQDEKERETDLIKRMKSLVRSEEVPCLVRLFIPIVILGNIGLFLSGHLDLGGTVNISGSFGGQSFNVEGFFEFSMAKSTIEMWQAGAKELAILVALFSGVWPYTKQIITLVLWFVPPRWVSPKRRGKTLHWLDVLGKWSMVDVFVLLMTLASFRLTIESPEHLAFLPEGLYSINMMVVPMWGLYANMLAQLVAQVSSHFIIHYHRKTVEAASETDEFESLSEPGKLFTHQFRLDYEASSERAITRRGVTWALSAALLSLVILVICGCSFPSFNIETFGLVGLAIESGNRFEQAQTYYSVFDLANMVMDQARYIGQVPDLIGLGTLASLLVITVFLIPLAQASVLLVQWFIPMNKKARWRNTVLNEILSAWQYMEVYVLSIIITAWQLGDVSEFMINAYCGELQSTFNMLAYYGILDKEDAQCFKVKATVEAASWLLVAASLLLCLLNHFVGTASRQKAQDDDTPPEKRRHTDAWQPKRPSQDEPSDFGVRIYEDEEERDTSQEDRAERVSISPISPRFTDYYPFVTRRQTADIEEQSEEYAMEDGAVGVAVEQNHGGKGASSDGHVGGVDNEGPETAAPPQSRRLGGQGKDEEDYGDAEHAAAPKHGSEPISSRTQPGSGDNCPGDGGENTSAVDVDVN